jgi:hypothetical protein
MTIELGEVGHAAALGRYCRKRRLVFSLVPRSQARWDLAKQKQVAVVAGAEHGVGFPVASATPLRHVSQRASP